MTNVNISLPEPMKEWLEAEVKRGNYGTVSEVVRSLIREAQQRAGQDELEQLLLEGIQSGKPLDGRAVMNRLRKKNAARVSKKKLARAATPSDRKPRKTSCSTKSISRRTPRSRPPGGPSMRSRNRSGS